MAVLTDPVRIGKKELKNRLVMPPMAVSRGTEDGEVTDALLAYYADKLKSGKIGMVVTEHSYVLPEGQAGKRQVSICDDGKIPGLKRLAEQIHACGSVAIIQISHAGAAAREDITHRTVRSAGESPLAELKLNETAVVLRTEEVEQVKDAFIAAAVRAQKAGFDGVELHAAHGYLLNQFYSPLTNDRKDRFGGVSVEDRIRLAAEVVKGVRSSCGEEFLISVRLGARDYYEGGNAVKDGVTAALLLEKAGADLLSISGGFGGFPIPKDAPGYFKDASTEIKNAVSIPVLLTGGIKTREEADQLLEEGACDLIGVGSALLRDSDWPEKAI